MRESFVFHADYICDLPDDYKAEFTSYTVNYGLYEIEPPIKEGTLEFSLWVKIKRRIDTEREKYERISEKRREAAQKRYNQRAQGKNEEKTEIQPEPKKEVAKKATFEKPTVSQIAEYCDERKNGIDAQAFFDFYESKGWKVGAVKMRDWKASVRTWEQRRKGEKKAGAVWGNENEVPDEITDLF